MYNNRHFVRRPFGMKVRGAVDFFLKIMRYQLSNKKRIDILIKKGLKIGKNVVIDPHATIDNNFCHLISIGNNCVICADAKILAHDSTIKFFTGGYGRAAKVTIKDNCIIGVNSVILPGVTIGPNVLVSAGSVVAKDISPDSCVVGVPARFFGKFSDYMSNHKERIGKDYVFEKIESITDFDKFNKEKEKMIKDAEKREIYFTPGEKYHQFNKK